MPRTIAAELGDFAANAPAALPAPVQARAATMVLDLLAAAAGGYDTTLAQTARGAAPDLFGPGQGSVWFGDPGLSWIGAAYANSSAASALDIDDGHRGAAGHAGAAVIPAALAAAELVDAGWGDTLAAIVLGYDIALRIAAARRIERLDRFTSGPWAGYGAAAAAGRLLGLDPAQMTQAIAITGAEAPANLAVGMSESFGSSVKEGIAWATVTGLGAVIRARHGGTGPEDMFESPDWFDREALLGGLGDRWLIQETYLKPYACCRYIHAALDAIGDMVRRDRPIDRLTLYVFREGLKLPNSPAPATLEQAQYSYPFCCALAALRGPEALLPMREAHLRDPEVLALAARVDLVAAPEFDGQFPAGTPARVVLDQGQGPVERIVTHPLGDVANPMSRAQLHAKFLHFTAGHLTPDRQQGLIGAVETLQGLRARSVLARLTAGPARQNPSDTIKMTDLQGS